MSFRVRMVIVSHRRPALRVRVITARCGLPPFCMRAVTASSCGATLRVSRLSTCRVVNALCVGIVANISASHSILRKTTSENGVNPQRFDLRAKLLHHFFQVGEQLVREQFIRELFDIPPVDFHRPLSKHLNRLANPFASAITQQILVINTNHPARDLIAGHYIRTADDNATGKASGAILCSHFHRLFANGSLVGLAIGETSEPVSSSDGFTSRRKGASEQYSLLLDRLSAQVVPICGTGFEDKGTKCSEEGSEVRNIHGRLPRIRVDSDIGEVIFHIEKNINNIGVSTNSIT